ncbi:restriction endonuclease subunit S [Macrococcus sp. S115]|uniref:restriction endonuclease subunit S n=1 Tax=Macrococcus sp. S115 TaxID=3047480 RepID=UPI0024BCC35F|nr:restriction endonuclease subunit S [Macrococcus sp. S115]MDJ1112633.1 restriction endonuclease subunit S [Macrococcus sp. S115]
MIKNREWKEFELAEVFNMRRGERQTEVSRKKGNIPYYSASQTNNGVTDYVSNPSFIEKNCIVISTFCHAFWAENEFSASDEMTLISHKNLNRYNALIITKLITQNATKYGFNRKAFSNRLKYQKIMLPVTDRQEIDWNTLESEGRNIIYTKEKRLIEYLGKRIDSIEELLSNKLITLENVQWKEFKIEDLFKCRRVKGKSIKKYNKGNIPYVSTSASNNGVIGFIDANDEDISESNTLTVNPITNAVFYQTYEYVGRGNAGSSINELHSKYLNKYTGLFIVKMLEHATLSKTSYAIQLNGDRLRKAKLKLPVKNDLTPDWDFMEQYTMQLELKKIKYLKSYLLNK